MTKKTRVKIDPFEQEITEALRPGAFIHDSACYSFVNGLERVTAKIAEIMRGDPECVFSGQSSTGSPLNRTPIPEQIERRAG
jgi:hypothetical protein